MIRSMPFSPTVVFTAPLPARRETAREPEKKEAPAQDEFNRMLKQQHEVARLANKVQQPAQAQAPAQTPMSAPTPESGPGTQAANEKDDTAKPTPNPAATRSAHRSRGPAGEVDGKPAQIDPEPPTHEARHGRKDTASEADVLAKLFKTPPKTPLPLPPKSAPFGADGPEEDGPGLAPGPAPLPLPTDEEVPVLPGQFNPQPPVIECPAELPMIDHTTSTGIQDGLGKNAGGTGTQALQARMADDAATTAQLATDAGANAVGNGLGAGAGSGTTAAAIQLPANMANAQDRTADRTEAAALAPATAAASAPAAALAGATTAPAASTARSATLDARPGTEAFEAKFSAQVAVWVREGVHEAQLQLNPAEMGPVRVAILLEGAAAQVNFTAEHALTRQALEQALPTLAGSLAEAGFTLAGGGVFDQPQQSERSGADDSSRSRARVQNPTTDTDIAGDAQRATLARPRGVVDLVA